jgi:aspartate aminotransferase-like enzyme
MHKKLFIPGPTEVRDEILQAMATPMIGHRTSAYADLHKSV